MRVALTCLLIVLTFGCDDGDGGGRDAGPRADGSAPPPPPSDECGPVRLTNYTLGEAGWCEFRHDTSALPAFVRDRRITAAIAEPYNGSSYDGDPGESCGECWEVAGPAGTEIVMITDLCPARPDEPCDGSFFHLDLSEQASQALNAGFMDEGAARRVPCPVDHDIHVVVNDENFSYLRLAFVSHRVPIRSGAVQAVDAGGAPIGAPVMLNRSGGAWEARGEQPLDRGGAGVVFTLTSATGQTVQSDVVVPTHPSSGEVFDLGVQFDADDPSGMCVWEPPGLVYGDAWGGIDRVRWDINPWGDAEDGFYGEVTDGCFGGGGSCVRLDNLGQFSGFHVYYRAFFPTSTFATLRMQLSASAPSTLFIMPSRDGERCDPTEVTVGPGFTEAVVDVASVCGSLSELNGFTVEHPGDTIALTLDDIRFE